jgi:hypothetical protein
MAEELPVRQAQHAGPQRRQHAPGQRRLALGVAAEMRAEQHVGAVLHQRHETQLREGALAATGARRAERGAVRPGVGDVQAGAIQAGQPPAAIPRPLAGTGGDRLHQLFVEPPQRRLSQPATRLRDAALAGDLDRLGAPQPAQALQQAAQHLAGARAHVKRQGDRVVDHHRRRQVPLALARLAGLGQDLAYPLGRHRPGDHAETDVVAQPNAGRKAGRNTGHRCRSRITEQADYTSAHPK